MSPPNPEGSPALASDASGLDGNEAFSDWTYLHFTGLADLGTVDLDLEHDSGVLVSADIGAQRIGVGERGLEIEAPVRVHGEPLLTRTRTVP